MTTVRPLNTADFSERTILARIALLTHPFAGRDWTPVYTPRNRWMIDRLGISPEVQRHMRTLIGPVEKNRRRELARRAAGMVPRADYEAVSAMRRTLVAELRKQGISLRAIAGEIGISYERVHQLLLT